MAEKRLRSMSRKELIEIIYVLQKNEQEMNLKIARLEDQLAQRDVILQKTGNIADAVVALNDLFAAAQKTADEYLASVRASVEASVLVPSDLPENDASDPPGIGSADKEE